MKFRIWLRMEIQERGALREEDFYWPGEDSETFLTLDVQTIPQARMIIAEISGKFKQLGAENEVAQQAEAAILEAAGNAGQLGSVRDLIDTAKMIRPIGVSDAEFCELLLEGIKAL